jgi:hypothetical protein
MLGSTRGGAVASLRSHVRIARPADEVWRVVSDAGAISTWFPAIERSTATASTRTIELTGGLTLEEDIVTNDPELRRFQYRIRPGALPVERHLGTIDVIADGDESIVVYSTEIEPDSLAPVMAPAIEGGVQGLKAHLEA